MAKAGKSNKQSGLFSWLGFRLPDFRRPLQKAFLATGTPAPRYMRGGVAARQAIGADEALGGARSTIFSIMVKIYPLSVPHHREHQHGGDDAGPKHETDHQKNQDVIQN